MQRQFQYLPIECLQRGQFQPRQHFNDQALQELAQSIRMQGLIEPIIVRPLSDERYEIIAGERRWRAAMLAQLEKVPCLIGEYTDTQTAAITVIENIQREDLNLIEEARSYEQLITAFHFQQEDIASLVGKSRSHVANVLRLLTLCPYVQQLLQEKQLSLGHARMLVGLSIMQQMTITQQLIKQQWSVRQLEQEVKRLKEKTRISEKISLNQLDIKKLEEHLSEQLATPVTISANENKGGWLQIKFYNNDTLSGLLERLGLGYDQ